MCLVNNVRAAHGLPALVDNDRLEQAAQGFAEQMVADDFFAHVAPSGLTLLDRLSASGYLAPSVTSYAIGENIAWGTGSLATPAAIVNAWVNSPGHLANILDRDFRDSAVGVAAAAPPSLADGLAGATYSQEFGVVQ
jgi:uncharacterized protein YkwD